jgi:hypothetical protein
MQTPLTLVARRDASTIHLRPVWAQAMQTKPDGFSGGKEACATCSADSELKLQLIYIRSRKTVNWKVIFESINLAASSPQAGRGGIALHRTKTGEAMFVGSTRCLTYLNLSRDRFRRRSTSAISRPALQTG